MLKEGGAKFEVRMLEQDIDRVCRKINSGAKFRLGRNHAGRTKLKLYTGPFGLFVRRFDLTDTDLLRLRQVLDMSKSGRNTQKSPQIKARTLKG